MHAVLINITTTYTLDGNISAWSIAFAMLTASSLANFSIIPLLFYSHVASYTYVSIVLYTLYRPIVHLSAFVMLCG